MKTILIAALAAVSIGVGACATTIEGSAKPEPLTVSPEVPLSICGRLNIDPGLQSVTDVSLWLIDRYGGDTDLAAEVLVTSVLANCPQHLPLLERWADVLGPDGSE